MALAELTRIQALSIHAVNSLAHAEYLRSPCCPMSGPLWPVSNSEHHASRYFAPVYSVECSQLSSHGTRPCYTGLSRGPLWLQISGSEHHASQIPWACSINSSGSETSEDQRIFEYMFQSITHTRFQEGLQPGFAPLHRTVQTCVPFTQPAA